MQKIGLSCALCLLLLTACSDKTVDTQAQAENQPVSGSAAPANAPAIGAPIAEAVPEAGRKPGTVVDGVLQLEWEALVPAGYEPEAIMGKYAEQIDKIAEGSAEDEALMEKIMAEFNSAPSNPQLDGKRVRIPGFVSPLDEKNGMVSEFLLVPYFGACIHSPPPPVNQTLLVRPLEGKSIRIDDIYQPVWVTGDLKVEGAKTELADAGYLISNAALEIYTDEGDAQGPEGSASTGN